MSRQCYFCKKRKGRGNKVSHSNMKSFRDWLPNLQSIKIQIDGKTLKALVCTKCLKKNKAKKALTK